MTDLNPLLVATDVPPIPAAQGWARAYDGSLGPLINLAQAVPGTPPPQGLLDRLAAEAGVGANAGYGPILGDTGLRTALARDVSTVYGATVWPSETAITAGCNQAFFVTMMALAKAGDAVMLPTPWYFNHKMTLDMLGIRALRCRRRPERFVPDPADARALLDPSVRAIVLVTPQQPHRRDLSAGNPRCLPGFGGGGGRRASGRRDLPRFPAEGHGRPHGLFADPGWRETVLQLYSFSEELRRARPPARRDRGRRGGPSPRSPRCSTCVQICPPRSAQPPSRGRWRRPPTGARRRGPPSTVGSPSSAT